MTDLVACLSTGKGTWAHVAKVIEGMEWNKIFLITNEFFNRNPTIPSHRLGDCSLANARSGRISGNANIPLHNMYYQLQTDGIFAFKDKFKSEKKVEMILIDTNKTITEMASDIKRALEGKITDLEVGLNIVSGDGREHMAIISALLQLGLGIRLVVLTREGVRVI